MKNLENHLRLTPSILHQITPFKCQFTPLNLLFKIGSHSFWFCWLTEEFEFQICNVLLLLRCPFSFLFFIFNFYPKLSIFSISPQISFLFLIASPTQTFSTNHINSTLSTSFYFLFFFFSIFPPITILHSFSIFFLLI